MKYRRKLDTNVIGSICFNCGVFEFGENIFDIKIFKNPHYLRILDKYIFTCFFKEIF